MSTIDLSALFPPHVAVVGVTEPTRAPLRAEEEALLGSIAERRRRDFATGRACARHALALLGVNRGAIHRGASGEPVWPAGICGSITHCDGCWAAAVARSRDTRSLGLDAERRRVLSDDVRRGVTLPDERDGLRRGDPRVPWDLLLFSAKESVFKAWYPIGGRWLGFHDARVAIDDEHQTFEAFVLAQREYAASLGLSTLQGRYQIDSRFVFTAVVVPAATASVFVSPPRSGARTLTVLAAPSRRRSFRYFRSARMRVWTVSLNSRVRGVAERPQRLEQVCQHRVCREHDRCHQQQQHRQDDDMRRAHALRRGPSEQIPAAVWRGHDVDAALAEPSMLRALCT